MDYCLFIDLIWICLGFCWLLSFLRFMLFFSDFLLSGRFVSVMWWFWMELFFVIWVWLIWYYVEIEMIDYVSFMILFMVSL